MKQDFQCYNADCALFEQTRAVTYIALGGGCYDNPVPICQCGWGMGAVSGTYLDTPQAP